MLSENQERFKRVRQEQDGMIITPKSDGGPSSLENLVPGPAPETTTHYETTKFSRYRLGDIGTINFCRSGSRSSRGTPQDNSPKARHDYHSLV